MSRATAGPSPRSTPWLPAVRHWIRHARTSPSGWSWRRSSASSAVWARSCSRWPWSSRRGCSSAIIVGFTPASPAGEGGAPITDALRPWALPLCVALGGLLSGIIVFRLAPEAEGHGTDAAIAAFHHRPRGIRGRVPIVKLVASAITIGSGGSAGREGRPPRSAPASARSCRATLDLDQHDARIAVAAGMAAGIGAIFRAPLGAAVLGAELLYRDDVESIGIAAVVHRDDRRLLGLRPAARQRPHLRGPGGVSLRPVPARLLRAHRPRGGPHGSPVHPVLLRRDGMVEAVGAAGLVPARHRRLPGRTASGSRCRVSWARAMAGRRPRSAGRR